MPAVFTNDMSMERVARVIFDYAARISKETDIGALVRLNANLACDLTGADRCSLWMLDEQTNELWTRVAHGIAGQLRIPVGASLVGTCVAGDQPVLSNEVRRTAQFLETVDQSTGYRTESVLCVPIRVEGKVIGALQALNKEGGFTNGDAELLGLMGVYAGTAIQTEQLRQDAEAGRTLKLELDIAREVQSRLLPKQTIKASGIDYVGYCRPARFVGGDYYDVFDLSDGSLGLTLGDVSGKGVPAALLMASIQSLLRNLMTREATTLGQVAEELNLALHRSSSVERYSTLFCGILNSERSVLRFVNAGHVPPFIVRAHGAIERPDAGGLPIGLMPGAQYQEQTLAVSPSDLIVCLSDGFLDIETSDGETWADEDVEEVLRNHCDRPVKEIASTLLAAVDDRSHGCEQFDDMTAVVVRITNVIPVECNSK